MNKGHLFIVTSLILCLGFTGLFADDSLQTDTPQGILKLPENISIELISPEHGGLMLSADDGQVELPQGKYRLESWTLQKKDDKGRTWQLSGDINTARMIEVGPERTELSIQAEPIACDLQIYPSQKTMNFTLGLKGPSGERLRVSGDAPGVKPDQLPQPTFVLYNPNNSYRKSYDFQSQCCGNFRFNWTPPAEVEGPFFIDITVAGPFQIDFKPRNVSELHQGAIAKQQVLHKQRMQQLSVMVFCYVVAVVITVGVLIKFRKSIAAAIPKSEGKRPFKRLTIVLGIFVLLMLLNPLFTLYSGDHGLIEALLESILFAVVLLIMITLVRGICRVRTKWPFVTIVLYGIFLLLLLSPLLSIVFLIMGHPETSVMDIGFDDIIEFYQELFSFSEFWIIIAWIVILALLVAQISLLIVPVRIKHQRPKARRGIWWTAIVAALLYTVLLFFAGLSVMAVLWGDDISEPAFWVLVGILPLNWIGWSIVFCLFSRSMEPESFIRRLMNWLIGGSILELLIAVPSHIIIRHRDVCCAHGLTAAGLTTGLAVIFFAFGPGLYFLYADRIRGKQPNQQEASTPELSQ